MLFYKEKRRFPRIKATFPARLQMKDPNINLISSVSAETVDISQSGMSIILDLPLPAASIINLQIDSSLSSSLLLENVEVIWSKFFIGNKFHSGLHLPEDRRNKIKQIIDEIEPAVDKKNIIERKKIEQLEIRNAKFEDIEELLRVEAEAWPEKLQASREMFESRLETFPEGFLCAVVEGKIEGFVVTEILNYDIQKHSFSWCESTDYGYIRKSHNPKGDTLYGVSLSVSSQNSILEIAAPLVLAGANFIIQRKLKQGLFGCRIPRYHKYADKMSVEEYIQATTKTGRQIDPELEMYQKIHLKPVKIIPNYIEDSESLNYGVLLVVINPFYDVGRTLDFWQDYLTSSVKKKDKAS